MADVVHLLDGVRARCGREAGPGDSLVSADMWGRLLPGAPRCRDCLGLCPVHDDGPEGPVPCDRPATARLTVHRHACGHCWPLAACAGHAESMVGENPPSRCHSCGRSSGTDVRPRGA